MTAQELTENLQIVEPQGRNFQMVVTDSHSEHYRHNAYEDYTADLILNLTKEGVLFVDIGAHYGFYSLLVGATHKDCQVIAFEPVPQNHRLIEKNLELNHLENVQAYNLAVSNRNETRSFNTMAHSSRGGFYSHHLSQQVGTIDVETIALDSFLKDAAKHSIVIKIDVEGHEIPVLEGMKGVLDNAEDVKLFVEFCPSSQRNAGYQPTDLLETIHRLGLEIFLIDDERREVYKLAPDHFKDWESYFGEGNFRKDFFNLFCAKKEKSPSSLFSSHAAGMGAEERRLLRQFQGAMAQREAELTRQRGEIADLQERAAALEAERRWLQDRIREMQGTKFWQLGSLYWRLHARLTSRAQAASGESADESDSPTSTPTNPARA